MIVKAYAIRKFLFPSTEKPLVITAPKGKTSVMKTADMFYMFRCNKIAG